MATFPKAKLVGLAFSCPEVTPVPERGIERVGLGALLVTVIDPVKVPADVGANTAFKVVLCPTAIVTGRLSPLIPKPLPVAMA